MVAPQPAPCATTPAAGSKPSTAEKFPFPGEASGGDATSPSPSNPPADGSNAAGTQSAGDAGAAGKKSTGGDFPFPEEDATKPGEKPVDAKPSTADKFPFPGEGASPGAGSSSSSSSSSSSTGNNDFPADDTAESPDAAGLKDKGSEGTQAPSGRRLLHRVNPVGTKLQSPEEREAEDLDVAHFYMQTGDLQGAYLRGQDAVKTAPDDPDAHFTLAEIALKLNKKDEAIAEYTACLKLDPVDKEAKAAHRELARLKP
jgi:hypothetical protein